MANAKDIKTRINSIAETQKITNAMYLIASTKMRRAKSEYDMTKPYFSAVKDEIKEIFRSVGDVESPYFYPTENSNEISGTYAYLVITADKGLAGAYNHNIIKETKRLIENHGDYKLFVVGEYGRRFFSAHNIQIEKSFLYTAQNPTFQRAREICSILLDLYCRGEVKKIYIVYTDYGNGLNEQAVTNRLLPFHKAQFTADDKHVSGGMYEFLPSAEKVLENIIPSYIAGFIYSALVDSFCCEQNSRMTAMESANRNAQKLLDDMRLEYNHIRQSAITQEITEISSGAKYQKRKKELAQRGEHNFDDR